MRLPVRFFAAQFLPRSFYHVVFLPHNFSPHSAHRTHSTFDDDIVWVLWQKVWLLKVVLNGRLLILKEPERLIDQMQRTMFNP